MVHGNKGGALGPVENHDNLGFDACYMALVVRWDQLGWAESLIMRQCLWTCWCASRLSSKAITVSPLPALGWREVSGVCWLCGRGGSYTCSVPSTRGLLAWLIRVASCSMVGSSISAAMVRWVPSVARSRPSIRVASMESPPSSKKSSWMPIRSSQGFAPDFGDYPVQVGGWLGVLGWAGGVGLSRLGELSSVDVAIRGCGQGVDDEEFARGGCAVAVGQRAVWLCTGRFAPGGLGVTHQLA
jgi:hypothetical protein